MSAMQGPLQRFRFTTWAGQGIVEGFHLQDARARIKSFLAHEELRVGRYGPHRLRVRLLKSGRPRTI